LQHFVALFDYDGYVLGVSARFGEGYLVYICFLVEEAMIETNAGSVSGVIFYFCPHR
jgi:hypothetical protein